MGFNDTYTHALFLDLETVAIDEAAVHLEPIEAPSNYKDPFKIADYIKEATAKALDRCSLDPDLCRIVALGWLLEGEDEPQVQICRDEQDEREALATFWEAATLPSQTTRRLVSFYGLAFDLPVLIRRSQYLDVPAPLLNLDKYRTPHLDVHARLTFNGVTKTHALDFYVKRFGLDVPADAHDGSEIRCLVEAGQWDAVEEHCRIDILKVAALARRIGLLQPAPVPVVREVETV